MPIKLKCYAPGDGALAFSYVEDRFDRIEGSFSQIATGGSITRQDVEKYVKKEAYDKLKEYLIVAMGEPREMETFKMVETWPKGKTFKSGKPKKPVMEEQKTTVVIQPQFRLCAPVFRVGSDSLRLGDTVYKYSVDEKNIFWTRDKEYTNHNTSIRWHWYVTSEEGKVLADEPDREVKNLSNRGAILWFLNHEKRIVQQYPEQNETTAATVDALQEAIQELQRTGMSKEDIFNLTDFSQVE